MTGHPSLDIASPLSARLPGEDRDPRLGLGRPAALSTSDAERDGDGADGEGNAAFGLDPGRPIPRSREARRKRGHPLLWGVSLLALGCVGVGAFLVSPYNTIVPVPGMVSTVRAVAARAGVTIPPQLLAPSAALASVTLPPEPSPVVRDRYVPTPRTAQMAELRALHAGSGPASATSAMDGASAGATGLGAAMAPPAPSSGPRHAAARQAAVVVPQAPPALAPTVPAPVPPHAPVAVRTGIVAGAVAAVEVPHEPGVDVGTLPELPFPPPPIAVLVDGEPAHEPGAVVSKGYTPNPTATVPSDAGDIGTQSPSASSTGHAVAGPPSVANSSAVATPPASRPGAPAPRTGVQDDTQPGLRTGIETNSQTGSQPAATPAGVAPVAAPLVAVPPDPLAILAGMQAAPLTPPDQISVMMSVTEMAKIVNNLRKQNDQLRSDFAKRSAETEKRLTDFERRVTMSEMNNALAAARDVGGADGAASIGNTSTTDAATVRSVSFESSSRAPAGSIAVGGKDRSPAISAPLPPSITASVTTGVKRYRVQAASPGLALLAVVDRGGGEGAQLEVHVGDTVPDVGHVLSIAQKGTAWVVTTDKGAIQ